MYLSMHHLNLLHVWSEVRGETSIKFNFIRHLPIVVSKENCEHFCVLCYGIHPFQYCVELRMTSTDLWVGWSGRTAHWPEGSSAADCWAGSPASS